VVYELLSWLTGKEVIDTVLQVLLFLATCGLIVVGIFQARAAHVQAEAAREQTKTSVAQQKEILSQGIAARRPFFVVIPAGAGLAALQNVGVGIAFKTEWRFLSHETFRGLVVPEQMGAIGVGDAKPLSFSVQGTRSTVTLQHLNSQGGIRVEYEDSSGKCYFSLIKRADEGHTNVVDTGEIT
jgi:hypothetical protein